MDNHPLFIQITNVLDLNKNTERHMILYVKVSNIRAFSPSPAFPNLTEIYMEDDYHKCTVTESPQEIVDKIQEAINPPVMLSPSATQLRNGYDAFITLWRAMETKDMIIICDDTVHTSMSQVIDTLNMNTMKGFRP